MQLSFGAIYPRNEPTAMSIHTIVRLMQSYFKYFSYQFLMLTIFVPWYFQLLMLIYIGFDIVLELHEVKRTHKPYIKSFNKILSQMGELIVLKYRLVMAINVYRQMESLCQVYVVMFFAVSRRT